MVTATVDTPVDITYNFCMHKEGPLTFLTIVQGLIT